MGQKVSPIGLRIGINKTWESKWYADNKDFSRFLNNDVKIRKFLSKKLKDASVASILIERTSKKTACYFGPREKRECKETGDEVGQPELGGHSARLFKGLGKLFKRTKSPS